jgi:hypothetical protein
MAAADADWIRRLLQLVHLYAERGSPKYEWAAMRLLQRYVTEGEPRLQHFAEVTADRVRSHGIDVFGLISSATSPTPTSSVTRTTTLWSSSQRRMRRRTTCPLRVGDAASLSRPATARTNQPC